MNTRTLIAILPAAYFFISCNKSEAPISNPPPPANTFTFRGVHDVIIDTSARATLALDVVAATGDTQQSVAVWVSGIPRGIYALVTPHIGTTDFTTSIDFRYDGVYDTAAPGTYPIKVFGASASDTETYDFNLTTPPFNGFSLSGSFMRTASMSHTANSVTITSQIYAGTLVGDNPTAWPTVDGTYTYMVGAAAGSSLNFTYTAKNSSYATYWTHGRGGADTAIVTISGGKMSIKSGILHAKTNVYPFTIAINARE